MIGIPPQPASPWMTAGKPAIPGLNPNASAMPGNGMPQVTPTDTMPTHMQAQYPPAASSDNRQWQPFSPEDGKSGQPDIKAKGILSPAKQLASLSLAWPKLEKWLKNPFRKKPENPTQTIPPGKIPQNGRPRPPQYLSRDLIRERLPVKTLPFRPKFTITADRVRWSPSREAFDKLQQEIINMPWDYSNHIDPFNSH